MYQGCQITQISELQLRLSNLYVNKLIFLNEKIVKILCFSFLQFIYPSIFIPIKSCELLNLPRSPFETAKQ